MQPDDPPVRFRDEQVWCGHQFLDPDAGRTRVRAILAEADEWCSVQQAQAHLRASIGGVGDQPRVFRDDMLAFHGAPPATSGPNASGNIA